MGTEMNVVNKSAVPLTPSDIDILPGHNPGACRCCRFPVWVDISDRYAIFLPPGI